jgi:hypothetical protein
MMASEAESGLGIKRHTMACILAVKAIVDLNFTVVQNVFRGLFENLLPS